ncbi:MAG: putative Ig domain-containing protein [Verrucomicrobiota bacterium]
MHLIQKPLFLCAILFFGLTAALHAQLSIPTSSALPSVLLGAPGMVVVAGSGGSPPYSWSVYSGTLPAGMALGSASGTIQGTPGAIGLSNFTLQLQDSAGRIVRKNFSLSVNPDSPRITAVALPEGVTVEPYSHQFAATLGKPPYTWNATTALPSGLTLSSAGLLSGAPALTTAGNHTISVRATGVNGQSSTARFPLVIRLSEAPTITTTPTLPGGTVGQLYTAVALQATGGKSPYSWRLASGPVGFVVSSNGSLSGYPAQASVDAAPLPLKIQVTGADGRAVVGNFTVVVSPTSAPTVTNAQALPSARVGLPYTVTFAATGGVSPYTFQAASALPAGLILSASGVLSGTSPSPIDTDFLVRVLGGNGASSIKRFVFKSSVSATPVITGPATISAPQGVPMQITLNAIGGRTPYLWGLANGTLPVGISLNASTGNLSGTPTVLATTVFSSRVTDADGKTHTLSHSFVVSPNAPVIAKTALPQAKTGEAFSHSFSATGGVAPYTWSTNSTLPMGLALSSNGVLSGTPANSASGNFSLLIRAAGANGFSQTASFTLGVALSPAPTITTNSTLPGGTVGQAYPGAVFQATGGKAPYSWVLQSGPVGLRLSANGSLTGYPAVASVDGAPLALRVVVSGSDGRTSAGNFSMVVASSGAPVFTTPELLTGAKVGLAYRQVLAATGGVAPCLFESISPLPEGLTLSSAGLISGVATAVGNHTLLLRVRGGDSAASVKEFVLKTTESIVPVTTGPSTIAAKNGEAFTAAIQTVGGAKPYSWVISSGSLPAGVTLDASTGIVSGTPAALATANFSTTVTDANSKTHTFAHSLVVGPNRPVITAADLPVAYGGIAFQHSFVATGGITPYAWSTTSVLPAGLTLSTNGSLSGTPAITASGNFSLLVKATGANGDSSTRSFNLPMVRGDVLSITTSKLASGVVGAAYSATLARVGGTAPFTWSVDALPPGISLNSTTGNLSGTPAGSFMKNATVRVEDAAGKSATRLLSWDISNPADFRIVHTTLRPVRAATAYSQTLTTQNGRAPVAWSLSSGSLPAGLTLSSNGVLSGNSSAAGNFTFGIQASDARGFTATRTFALRVGNFTVNAPPDPGGRLFTEITGFVQGMPPHRAIAVSDFDNDGLDDLLVSTSPHLPNLPGDETLSNVRLWKSGGPWQFTDISAQAGLTGVRPVLVADFDNDGLSDILHIDAAKTAAALYRNSGNGVFARQDLPGLLVDELTAYNNVKAADMDQDGDLDLVFAVNEPGAAGAAIQISNQADISPDANPLFATKKYLVRSTFLHPRASICDPNRNGRPDLVLVPGGGTVPEDYRNSHGVLLALNNLTYFSLVTTSGMNNVSPYSPLFSWDMDNSGVLDFLNGSSDWLAQSKPTFQVTSSASRFSQHFAPVIHGNGSVHFDAALFDADLDADLDAVWTGVRSAADSISKIWENKRTYMLASGNKTVAPTAAFQNSTAAWGLDVAMAGAGLHHAGGYSADLDNDGDPDLVFWAGNANSNDSRYAVYRNETNLRNPTWLKVELLGVRSQAQGDGALVDVEIPAGTLHPPGAESATPSTGQKTSGKIRLTQRMGGDTGSVHGSRLHFGLAQAATANVSVTWPGNVTHTLKNVPANQILQISEFPALDTLDSDADGLSDAREMGFGRYDILDGNMGWDAAKAAAEARGGHLATINSALEWTRIQQVLRDRLEGRVLWIGANATGTAWNWTTGEPWKHSAWGAGMPVAGQSRAILEPDGTWTSASNTSARVDGYLFESGAMSDPFEPDTDFDGYSDSAEAAAGSDPAEISSVPSSEKAVVAPFVETSIKDLRLLTPEWVCAVVDATSEILAARQARFGAALAADQAQYDADTAAGIRNWVFAYSKCYRSLTVRRSYHLPLFARFDDPEFWTVGGQTPLDATVWSHSVDGMPGLSAADIPTFDTIKYSRTADMVYLKLPSDLLSGQSLEVCGGDGRARTLSFNDHETPCWSIKVNQSAYDRSASKKAAYLGMWLPGIGGADFSDFAGRPFHIKAYQPGDRWDRGTAVGPSLFSGNITLRKSFAEQDVDRQGGSNLTGENVYELDFSAFDSEGLYCIQIPGLGRSWPFKVTAAGYAEAFYWTMKGLFTQRCGIALQKPHTAWERPLCHEHTFAGNFIPETERFYTTGYRSGNLAYGFRDAAGNRIGLSQFTLIGNSPVDAPIHAGVKGGWHDAADYDRRIFHYNVVWDLLAAFEAFPAKFSDSQLNIPESGNGIPDILDEAAYGVDVWKATQRVNGGVSSWIEQESHPITFANDMQATFAGDPLPMFSSVPDRMGSMSYAASAAWLGRVLAPYDPARSAAYIESARLAYAFGRNSANAMTGLTFKIDRPMRNANLLGQTIRFDEDPVVLEGDFHFTEKAFAAMAMYQATGEQPYLADWTATNLGPRFGSFLWRVSPSRAVPLLKNPGLTASEATTVRNAIAASADSYLNAQNNHPYRMYWYAPHEGWFHTFGWGAFHQRVRLLLAALVATGDQKYKTGMQNAADFFLGCNPLGSSMISGIGTVYPVVVQHNHSLMDQIVEPTPGLAPYWFNYGIYVFPFIIADDGHDVVDEYFKPTGMVYLPDRLGRAALQSDLDAFPKVGDWDALNGAAVEPAKGVLWDNFPILRRKTIHPGNAVAQNEFTLWETGSPLAMMFGVLTNEGWVPGDDIKNRQPKLTPEEVPFYTMP